MTIYYLSSVDGSDASDGLSWDNAFATFKYGVETASAAASGPHLLYVDNAHSESLSADTTITAAGNIRILCVNRNTGALATTAVVGAQATNYAITINGAFNCYFYGLTFKVGTGSSSKSIIVSSTDGCDFAFEQCTFAVSSTHTTARLYAGGTAAGANSHTVMTNCTISYANTSQYAIVYGGLWELVGCTISAAGSVPAYGFAMAYGMSRLFATGCDFGKIGANPLIKDSAAAGTTKSKFANCKIGSAVYEAATTVLNGGGHSVEIYNCSDGDNHYALAHYNPLGETTVSATIYANDGAAYDATNKCSWKIVTTANCSYYTPYVSPWMDVYHSGTSAISPYLEILRSGSTTKYQDDEVWGEFSYQGTSGSTRATIVSDRMTPLGTAADQTASSLDASGWTGEDATNNAYMKLEAGSITPAEIGHIRARVCVGEPSITVYVDPKIRGLS